MSASAASPSSAMVVVSLLSSFSRIFAKFFFVSKVRLFSEPGAELVLSCAFCSTPVSRRRASESVSISSSSSNEVSVSVSLAAFLAAAFLSRSIFAASYPAYRTRTTSMKSFKFKERLSDSSTDSNCLHTSKTFFASTCEIFGINADTA